MRALVLVDGEHYAPVVRDALAALPYDVVGALLVGGTEKLRGGEDYGVPLARSLDELDADVVVDLSDEPVLGPRERMLWASRALALGLPYVGADFRFDPPPFHEVACPALAVIGTGKRVGKTAVAGHVARLLARERRVVVVSMGRGGPPEPEVVETPPGLDDLVALSRSGRHAASDHLETAALAGVPTVGCRRAGGGLAGATFDSNVLEGARAALDLDPELLVFDGSGAALPPVAADARILVTSGLHDVREGLNAYRVLDLEPRARHRRRRPRGDPRDRRGPGRARGAAAPPAAAARRASHGRLRHRPGADRASRRGDRPRLAEPGATRRAAGGSAACRRRGLSRGAEGGGGRRRRRGGARARGGGRAGGERRGRRWARRAGAGARRARSCARDGAAPDHAAAARRRRARAPVLPRPDGARADGRRRLRLPRLHAREPRRRRPRGAGRRQRRARAGSRSSRSRSSAGRRAGRRCSACAATRSCASSTCRS